MSRKMIFLVKELYKIIADAQDELKEIREKCTHLDVFEGNYTYSDVTRMHLGWICRDCGDFIGEMKTAKEWIENPRYSMSYYDGDCFPQNVSKEKIKEYLLQGKYTEEKLTWDKFTELTDYADIYNKVKKWLLAKQREKNINDIIENES